jgi:Arc/MetJ-type ribon-helix-helix transcriptional regulator
MDIQLHPDLERRVRLEVEQGRFASPDALVAAAVTQFLDSDLEDINELRAAIQAGIDDAERGDVLEFDEASLSLLAEEVKRNGRLRAAARR